MCKDLEVYDLNMEEMYSINRSEKVAPGKTLVLDLHALWFAPA